MSRLNAINRNRNIRFAIQALALATSVPLRILGIIVPKSKNVWIFGNHLGEKDNSFYLFQYVQKQHPNIKSIWISKTKKNISTETKSGHYYLSLKGIYYQYISSVSIHTTGLGDFAKFTLARKYRVQLWHGIPIKRILMDSPEMVPSLIDIKIFKWVLKKLIAFKSARTYDLLIASSETMKVLLAQAFNQPLSKIAVTGYPRHDIIKQSKNNALRETSHVLYAPTWRSNEYDAIEIIEKGMIAIRKHNKKITLCIHPLNKGIAESLTMREGESIYGGGDINKDLHSFSSLVTDYSSIAIDFLFLDKSVAFFTPDIHEYSRDRGLYDHFTKFIDTNQISIIGSSSEFPHTIKKQYFKYVDNDACTRIIIEIRNRFK
jgi:CDP-glycerol glycerophosphotransferase